MAEIKVLLPGGSIVTATSNNLTEQEMAETIIKRQQFFVSYCEKMGWPTDPSELSWEQIFEIRKQPEWQQGGHIKTP